MATGRYRKVIKPQRAGIASLHRCISVTLVFFFICKLFAADVQASRIIKAGEGINSGTFLSHSSDGFFRNPAGPKGISLALEGITEENNGESKDDETKAFGWAFDAAWLVGIPPDIFSDNILSAMPAALQNKATVPLFILYHSWKTFPH